jgi:hypothetical protein
VDVFASTLLSVQHVHLAAKRGMPRVLNPRAERDTGRMKRDLSSGAKITTGRGARRGTEVASTFYSLLETAKLHGLDPARYLREAALADARGEVLLPCDCPR